MEARLWVSTCRTKTLFRRKLHPPSLGTKRGVSLVSLFFSALLGALHDLMTCVERPLTFVAKTVTTCNKHPGQSKTKKRTLPARHPTQFNNGTSMNSICVHHALFCCEPTPPVASRRGQCAAPLLGCTARQSFSCSAIGAPISKACRSCSGSAKRSGSLRAARPPEAGQGQPSEVGLTHPGGEGQKVSTSFGQKSLLVTSSQGLWDLRSEVLLGNPGDSKRFHVIYSYYGDGSWQAGSTM